MIINNNDSNDNLTANSQDSYTETGKKPVVGGKVRCRITGTAEYGCFADCGDGYRGLVHKSQITKNFVHDVRDYLNIDDVVEATVLEIKSDNKLQLSTIDCGLTPKKTAYNDSKKGFKNLEKNLDSWVKEGSNK